MGGEAHLPPHLPAAALNVDLIQSAPLTVDLDLCVPTIPYLSAPIVTFDYCHGVDVDIVTRDSLFIEVGGGAKDLNRAHFGQQLAALRDYATQQGGRAVYYAPGTDPALIEFATRRLGPDNVLAIPTGVP